MKKIFLTFASIALLACQAGAQAPKQFNYQGVARTASGAPMANQSVSIRISILDGSATGTAKYVEKQSVTTNAYGLYNLAIGAGTAVTGTMAAVDWGDDDKYIKVEIDPAGGSAYTLLGTTQLLSVPYAMYAAEGNPGPVGPQGPAGPTGPAGATGPAGSLTGAAGGDLSGTYPNPTIGSSKVTAAKIASNAVTEAKIASNAVTTAKIANSAVTADKIASNAVTTAKINNGAVTADKLASDAVTTAKIATGAVTETKLASNSVTAAKIASNAITTAKIANGAVTAAKLNSMGAGTGQVLQWNGTVWTPTNTNNIGVTLDGAYRADPSNNSQRITANSGAVEIAGTDGLIVNGTYGQGADITNYSGNSRLFFNPKKSAFRAGYISNINWINGNVGVYSFASGYNTKASGISSTAMGYQTIASGNYATAMGNGTVASGESSTAMGASTTASGTRSTAMGYGTVASGNIATSMGVNTTASGWYTTAMGEYSIASGDRSTAMGRSTIAYGDYSMAMGNYSTAAGDYATTIGRYITLSSAADGSMYLADGSRTSAAQTDTRTSVNRFYARFDNGYYLYTDGTGNYGITMAHQGNSWSTISDSTKKENFRPAPDFLGKIAQMKIGSWNYKGQDRTKYRHYGPYAQEFYYHFGNDGVGTIGNDTTIASADIDGVMMIAIQQLIKENKQLKADNAVLKVELSTQKANTEVRLSRLEAFLSEPKLTQK